MTPVQLPEVPTPHGPWHATSDDEGFYTYTAAQLREYATQAVVLDRLNTRFAIQAALEEIEVPKMAPVRSEYWKAGVRRAIRAIGGVINPSETNSD